MRPAFKIYMLAFMSFLVATTEFIIAGILDKIAAVSHVSISTAGQLITVFALANAVGTPVVMMVMAKIDLQRVLMFALLLLVAGSVLTSTLSGFGFLMFARVVLAVGSGVFVTAAKAVASKLAPPGRQAGAIGTIIMGFSAALIVGLPLGRVAASSYDWRVIFWGIGFLSLLAIFAVVMMIPSTEGGKAIPLGKQLALLRNPKIAIALAVEFFWQVGYAMLFAYIAPFLIFATAMSGRTVSIALFAFGIATLVGSRLGGFMSHRIGMRPSLLGGLILHVILLVLLSTVAESTFVAIPLLMLWAISAWSSGPILQYHMVSLAPQASGIMLSLYTSVLQLSIAVAAGIGGIAVESLSVAAVSWVGAVSVAFGAILAAVSFSRHPNRRTVYESN